MNLLGPILSFTAILLTLLVFIVHIPTKNVSLLLIAAVCCLFQLFLFLGFVILPFVSFESPFLLAFCEIQSFIINVLGISIYGVCMCLAIELHKRTSADVVLNLNREYLKNSALLYCTLSLVIPLAFIIAAVIFRTKSYI
ncbi:hypothetical protein HK096_002918 [Nowakowskiella sp. JEL0078]|nr:hypothetical protein HK096_002918 [Nowakowskiella sp. JEL0078]